MFPSRFQPLSVESPGWASSWCCSGNKWPNNALHPWAGLRTDLPDPVSPRKDQEQLHLTHQHGTRCSPERFLHFQFDVGKATFNYLCRSFESVFFFFFQSSQVKLWWPNGHGDQPFYLLTVRGFQDGFLVLNTESKVRVRCPSTLTILLIFYSGIYLNQSKFPVCWHQKPNISPSLRSENMTDNMSKMELLFHF